MTDTIDRRAFLKRSAATAGGALAATSGLQRITEHAAFAAPAGASAARVGHGNVPASDGYGPLHRVADQRGIEVLALPAGFTYVTFGWTATPMLSGGLHPRSHDGMGSFAGPGGTVRLIRNHENRNAKNVSTLGVPAQGLTKYDPAANGGCVTLDFDPLTRTTVAEFVSIAGTHVNCAGGIAYVGYKVAQAAREHARC